MNAVLRELRKAGNPAQRANLMRFFKTGKGEYGEGDVFLGVKVPQTRAIVKERWRDCTDAAVDELIASSYHEARLAGLLILCRRYKAARGNVAAQARIVGKYLASTAFINNWDLVDLTSYELLGDWYLTRDRSPLKELAHAGKTLWEQRIAMVTTLQFIRHGDFTTTLEIAQMFLHHSHDLIHKAVGWMLREIGKRDCSLLEDFLKSCYREMPRTMLRYAIEKFPEPLRQRYLKGKVK